MAEEIEHGAAEILEYLQEHVALVRDDELQPLLTLFERVQQRVAERERYQGVWQMVNRVLPQQIVICWLGANEPVQILAKVRSAASEVIIREFSHKSSHIVDHLEPDYARLMPAFQSGQPQSSSFIVKRIDSRRLFRAVTYGDGYRLYSMAKRMNTATPMRLEIHPIQILV